LVQTEVASAKQGVDACQQVYIETGLIVRNINLKLYLSILSILIVINFPPTFAILSAGNKRLIAWFMLLACIHMNANSV